MTDNINHPEQPQTPAEPITGEILPALPAPHASQDSPQVEDAPSDAELDPDDLPPELQFEPVPRNRKRIAGITDLKQRRYIAYLASSGSVTMAAKAIGVSTNAMYDLRRAVAAESFAAAWDRAIDMGARRVLDMLTEHSIHGTPETVMQDGKVVAERRRYNTRAMQWIVQQRFPEQYGGSLHLMDGSKSPMPNSLKILKKKWKKEWERKHIDRHRQAHRLSPVAQARLSAQQDRDAAEEVLKRLKVLKIRLEYAEAYNYVGDPEKQAAFELLKGPQPWDDIAKSKAEMDAQRAKLAEKGSEIVEEGGDEGEP